MRAAAEAVFADEIPQFHNRLLGLCGGRLGTVASATIIWKRLCHM